MEEEERTFTPGQAEAMDALLSGRNVFLSGNAGTGKSYVLNAFIEELEEREVPYLAMAPTGIAAQNLHNGTTIHRTLQVGFGVLDPHDENRKTLTRKVLNKAEVVIIDEVSMCRIDLFERVMNMVLAAKRVSGRKQVVLVGDFFQLPPVVTDDDRKVLMQLWPGNDDGYAFKSPLWEGMGFEPHVLTEVVRQSDPEFIGQLNRARIGDRDCIGYFNERSVSDRKRAPGDDLWLCATNRMASTINDERVPFCWDYQIKGFFKDACSSLRRVPGTRSSKLTAFKKVIDGTVFVEQRRIPFQLPEGAECGRCERPLRASSASGERVALAASETVPAGTVLEFSILVMNPKDAETVREWLDYGALRGLFQWRNSGKGRFGWEEVARD